MECLGNIAYRYVFSSREIYRMEVKEAVILDFLMDRMIQAVLYYDTDRELNAIDSRVLSLFQITIKRLTVIRQKERARQRSCISACFW